MENSSKLQQLLGRNAAKGGKQRQVEAELVVCLQALQNAADAATEQDCWKDARWEDIEKDIIDFVAEAKNAQASLQAVNKQAQKNKSNNVISFRKKVKNQDFPKQLRAVKLFVNSALISSRLYIDQMDEVRFNLVGDHQAELRRTYFQALLSFPDSRPSYVIQLMKRIYELLVARGLGSLTGEQLQAAKCHINQNVQQVDEEFRGKLSGKQKAQKSDCMGILDMVLDEKMREKLDQMPTPNIAPQPAG